MCTRDLCFWHRINCSKLSVFSQAINFPRFFICSIWTIARQHKLRHPRADAFSIFTILTNFYSVNQIRLRIAINDATLLFFTLHSILYCVLMVSDFFCFMFSFFQRNANTRKTSIEPNSMKVNAKLSRCSQLAQQWTLRLKTFFSSERKTLKVGMIIECFILNVNRSFLSQLHNLHKLSFSNQTKTPATLFQFNKISFMFDFIDVQSNECKSHKVPLLVMFT